MMETLGCRDGLQLALKLGEPRVAVETNGQDRNGMSNTLLMNQFSRRLILLVLPFIVSVFLFFVCQYIELGIELHMYYFSKVNVQDTSVEIWHVTLTCLEDLLILEASAR